LKTKLKKNLTWRCYHSRS